MKIMILAYNNEEVESILKGQYKSTVIMPTEMWEELMDSADTAKLKAPCVAKCLDDALIKRPDVVIEGVTFTAEQFDEFAKRALAERRKELGIQA